MPCSQIKINSPVGALYVVASEKGVQALQKKRQANTPLLSIEELNPKQPEEKVLQKAYDQLQQYFLGRRQSFDLPLDLQGTDFQKKVWKQLLKIPYGKTVSYRWMAEKIQQPKAARAVGNANGKNPVCVIVPCHRVIAADGSLGGYSSGLNMKKYLLSLES